MPRHWRTWLDLSYTGPMWSRFIAATVAVGLLLAFSSLPAHAEIFSTAGLYFSDELGGFRLISVSGSGSTSDPIVVVEEITELGPAVLVIRGTQIVPTGQVPDVPADFVHLGSSKW